MKAGEKKGIAAGASIGRLLIIGVVLAGLLTGSASDVCADGVLRPGVDGTDCRGCHSGGGGLPDNHLDIGGMTYPECVDCHAQKKVSMRRQLPLGHVHLLSGIGCGDCHVDLKSQAPLANDDCFNCHGSAREIADRTAESKPNPHDSIHYGLDLDCELCHHQHKASENFCTQCHASEFKVP